MAETQEVYKGLYKHELWGEIGGYIGIFIFLTFIYGICFHFSRFISTTVYLLLLAGMVYNSQETVDKFKKGEMFKGYQLIVTQKGVQIKKDFYAKSSIKKILYCDGANHSLISKSTNRKQALILELNSGKPVTFEFENGFTYDMYNFLKALKTIGLDKKIEGMHPQDKEDVRKTLEKIKL